MTRLLSQRLLLFIGCGALISAPSPAHADFSTTIELEQRFFLHDAPVANRERNYSAIGGELQYSFSKNRGRQTFTATAAGRLDYDDPDRRYIEILDLDNIIRSGSFEYRFGIRRIFWGVTEAVHLVDVVNQTDLREGFDGEDKFGQAMLNIAWFSPFGTFDAFAIPLFRERKFPGPMGRFALPFEILEQDRRYVLGADRDDVDFAARWNHSLFDMDVAISYFNGTVREPRNVACIRQGSGFAGTENDNNCDIDSAVPDGGALGQLITALDNAGQTLGGNGAIGSQLAQIIANIDPTGLVPNQAELTQAFLDAIVIVPFYEPLQQIGFEWQYNYGDLALKAEATRRELARSTPASSMDTGGQGNTSGQPDSEKEWLSAAAGGFEYTLVGVLGSNIDVGLIGEYLYNQNDRAIVGDFDDDIVAGTRLEFNDVKTTRIIAAVIQDTDNEGRYYSFDATRRLSRNWSGQIEGLWLSNFPTDDPASFFADEDLITLTLKRFF